MKQATSGLGIRALVFTVGGVIITLSMGLISVFWLLLPHQKRYAFVRMWCRSILRWLELVCNLRYQVEGLEHLPAVPAVILSKHQSAWETIAFPLIFPPHSWVLKRELLGIPVFGWVLARMRPIAIDRTQPRRALRQLLQQGSHYLKQGLWVVIFPEGTRVAPRSRKRYATGGALLAENNAVPVVPVAHNAGEFWPRQGWLKYPGNIRVCIGPPIDTVGKTAAEINAQAEAWIEQTTEVLHDNGQPSV